MWWCRPDATSHCCLSGGFRKLERGVQPLARSTPENFRVAMATSSNINIRTKNLEPTLGLVKHLEISRELIRECVTVPGCCCCIPLLYNHLMNSFNYLRKNTLLAAKGGCICTPLTPLNGWMILLLQLYKTCCDKSTQLSEGFNHHHLHRSLQWSHRQGNLYKSSTFPAIIGSQFPQLAVRLQLSMCMTVCMGIYLQAHRG